MPHGGSARWTRDPSPPEEVVIVTCADDLDFSTCNSSNNSRWLTPPTGTVPLASSRQSSQGSLQAVAEGLRQGSPAPSRQSSQASSAQSSQGSSAFYRSRQLSSRQSSPTSQTRHTKSSAKSSRCASPILCRRERSPHEARELVHVFLDQGNDADALQSAAEELLFESMPYENIKNLEVTCLRNDHSRHAFHSALAMEGGKVSRVRLTWHLAGSAAAASAIQKEGISCDGDHCVCGRYGRGGYVATSAAKANAYADSECEDVKRHLFLVLALPEQDITRGESGTRPQSTVADFPNHPTEYCFVDGARLHCVCRLDYSWVPTGRRTKIVTAGGHCSAWRKRRASV